MPTDIPFKDLPRQSALFLRYLERDPAAMRFYPAPPALDALETVARATAPLPFPRREVAAALRRQNESFGADAKVFRGIDDLGKPGGVAVLTGQQTGIFGGPLYTVYKALTAVELAVELRRRGVSAVPVFWMETEDHDYKEATKCAVMEVRPPAPAAPSAPAMVAARGVDFGAGLFPEAEVAAKAVGSLRFTETVGAATRAFAACWGDSPQGAAWKAEAVAALEGAYAPGASFAEAFARTLHWLFAGTGLVVLDPADPGLKRLLTPVFRRAVAEAGRIRAALTRRDGELRAAGFHSQVKVLDGATTLFLTVDGRRHALEQTSGPESADGAAPAFRLKNGGGEFSEGELLELAERRPEAFSPNVLLRPIAQDALLPTVAYAGGAAEVAYFAQVEALYKIFGRAMPVVWPRDAFTLVEPEVAAAMGRTGVGFTDVFAGEAALVEKALLRAGGGGMSSRLERLYGRLDAGLRGIQTDAGEIEGGLEGVVDAVRRKALHNVRNLKARVVRMETGGGAGDAAADAATIANHLLPEGNLQERELTIFHFLAKHGPAVMDALRAAVSVEGFTHRLVELRSLPR
ncbi:MAG: bacillithiol biosynthesis cysteine-adding enzyme BshC [Acidobacteriota bacterium]|jgi:bacillithiol biosynthesis cysteine-adding enzyme BshC|nr:bacillithiol biosynthesis cysteine-adding enzyme BshC [Acidobacteriota bacterium]